MAALYARVVVSLRWFVVVGWILGAGAAWFLLPASMPNAGLRGFVPPHSSAIRTEKASLKAFGFPLITHTLLVQHNARGLSPYEQAEAVLRGIAVDQGAYPGIDPIRGALPVTNTLGIFPSSSQRNTTALTYLFFDPSASFFARTNAARAFGRRHLDRQKDGYLGVTGSVPARVAQERILFGHLHTLEIATLAVVIAVVAVRFRSVLAPLVALVTAGLSYFMAIRVTNTVGTLFGLGVPAELKPLVLALILGIVTDYSIFFLSRMRSALHEGADRLEGARSATARTGRIILVAGLAVAAGTAVMLVARSSFFSAFGPILALSVATAVLVSLTLLPALLAIFGGILFWPTGLAAEVAPGWVRRGARLLARRSVAAVLVVACVAGLGLLATEVRRMRLGVAFLPSLPAAAPARASARAAAAGFAPGIVEPTVLLLRGGSVAGQEQQLARLGRELSTQPGVAGVVGPGNVPGRLERGVLTSRSGGAARLLVILNEQPLGAHAIGDLDRLQQRLPRLVHRAGLHDVRFGLAGDTALASELVAVTKSDLVRIAVAALLVNLALLVLFLRALVAPVLLLACSVLALGASMGVMTLVFQGVFGHAGITFYVPFATAVLLLSLGSDYNIYGVGSIWDKAGGRTLREAVAERLPETSGAITAAGFTLAASFAMLAVVPLRPFRELAVVMGVGILIDALVVRSLLVPSLLTLVGGASRWPRRSPARPPDDVRTETRGTDRGATDTTGAASRAGERAGNESTGRR